MKELLLQYARYNIWANKQIIDTMLPLERAILDKDIMSSFSSIRATTHHIIGAESIWLQRLQLVEHPVWVGESFGEAFDDTCAVWQKASADLEHFISKQKDDAALTHKCEYNDRRGQPHKSEVCHILQHVFNHTTYHRGQLVTMLRQAGVEKIPSTDFIAFVWKGH